MTNGQMTNLAIKAHAFNVICDLIADVWEYGDDKKAVTHTLFEINGAIQMANRMIQAVRQVEKGAEDEAD